MWSLALPVDVVVVFCCKNNFSKSIILKFTIQKVWIFYWETAHSQKKYEWKNMKERNAQIVLFSLSLFHEKYQQYLLFHFYGLLSFTTKTIFIYLFICVLSPLLFWMLMATPIILTIRFDSLIFKTLNCFVSIFNYKIHCSMIMTIEMWKGDLSLNCIIFLNNEKINK